MNNLLILIIINLISINFYSETFAITNFEIIKICRYQKKRKKCVERLKRNREFLDQGKPIEIPVLPFRK
tara:strand:+ start:1301 stop:1507 length:207 start_codon:yes stop_codon:yes gene_type:complete